MQSTRNKWTANSMIGPLTPVVSPPPTSSRSPMRPSQLARAVVSPRVLRPVLSTLSRQSSRRSERHLARRTISAYPVSKTRFHYYIVVVLVLIQLHSPSPSNGPYPSRTCAFSIKQIFFSKFFGFAVIGHMNATRCSCPMNSHFPQYHPARWFAWTLSRSRADHPRLSSDVGHLLRRV